MADLINIFYVPTNKPIEGVWWFSKKKFYDLTPKVSGEMASHDDVDYDPDTRLITFTNDCIYGAYQDNLIGKDGHLGAHADWFQECSEQAFEYALEVTEDAKEEELDWWERR